MSEITGSRPVVRSTRALASAALYGTDRVRALADVQAEVAQQVERRAETAGAGRSNRSLGTTPLGSDRRAPVPQTGGPGASPWRGHHSQVAQSVVAARC